MYESKYFERLKFDTDDIYLTRQISAWMITQYMELIPSSLPVQPAILEGIIATVKCWLRDEKGNKFIEFTNTHGGNTMMVKNATGWTLRADKVHVRMMLERVGNRVAVDAESF